MGYQGISFFHHYNNGVGEHYHVHNRDGQRCTCPKGRAKEAEIYRKIDFIWNDVVHFRKQALCTPPEARAKAVVEPSHQECVDPIASKSTDRAFQDLPEPVPGPSDFVQTGNALNPKNRKEDQNDLIVIKFDQLERIHESLKNTIEKNMILNSVIAVIAISYFGIQNWSQLKQAVDDVFAQAPGRWDALKDKFWCVLGKGTNC